MYQVSTKAVGEEVTSDFIRKIQEPSFSTEKLKSLARAGLSSQKMAAVEEEIRRRDKETRRSSC